MENMLREIVDKAFSKMRAKLFNLMEQTDMQPSQIDSYKRSIKGITGEAWNAIGEKIDDNGEEEE